MNNGKWIGYVLALSAGLLTALAIIVLGIWWTLAIAGGLWMLGEGIRRMKEKTDSSE